MAKTERPKLPGFITISVERLFRFLQFIPPWVILGNRPDIQNKYDGKVPKKVTRRRAIGIDIYILIFLIADTFFAVSILNGKVESSSYRLLIFIFALFRIVDIIQVNINITLFDHLRIKSGTHSVASGVRTIINNVINYFELVLCFGFLYFYNFEHINDANSLFDAFYLSINSQIFLSVTDATPAKWNIVITTIQGIIGLFFSLLIFARVISILPDIKSDLKQEQD